MADTIYNDPPQNVTFEASKVEEPLYSAFLANAIFNGCLCHSTIMLNIVTVYALRRTSTLSNTLKTLLLNLAVADLGIGLLGQPLEVVYLTELLRWNRASPTTDRASAVVLSVFYLSSLCSIMAISADRFIAIQMPLRYEDLVTHRRVVTVVITIWLFSALISPCSVFLLATSTTFAFFVTVVSIFFLTTTLLYYKIYLTIRRHKEQIQSQMQQLTENNEPANSTRITKSANSTFCINLLFWICYLPHLFVSTARRINGDQNVTIKVLYVFSETLVLFNSSLNPVVYCWKMRQIRHTMLRILRKMSRCCTRH